MKIAIIDIDGVLNYYPQTFLDFLYKEKNCKYETLNSAKESISYAEYKILKSKYRNSDYKHDAEPRKGSSELLYYLRENNYLIYIITARELYKNDMLEKTICWLKKNNLIYDFIYMSKKKDFTIFEKFKNIDLIIEDNVDNINNIMKICNIKCYNIINKDNQKFKANDACIRVNNLFDIITDLERNKREA